MVVISRLHTGQRAFSCNFIHRRGCFVITRHYLTPTFAGRIAPALPPLPVGRLAPAPRMMDELLCSQPSSRHLHLSANISPHNPSPSLWNKQSAQITSELRMKATCRVLPAPSRPSRDRERILSRSRPRHGHHHPPAQHHAPHRLCVPFGIAEQPTTNFRPPPPPRWSHILPASSPDHSK